MIKLIFLNFCLGLSIMGLSQQPQPVLSQVMRLTKALDYLGSPLRPADKLQIQTLLQSKPDSGTVGHIQRILDPYCLAVININPEARVKVTRGPAKAELVQGGWKTFLVKVHNEAGVTAQLQATSPNAAPLMYMSNNSPHAAPGQEISPGELAQRFLEIGFYRKLPLLEHLSGLELEYNVLQINSKIRGKGEAIINFNIGQEKADLADRNALPILFNSQPAIKVILKIKDLQKDSEMASFTFRDELDRIYPLPSRRLAETDEYPDFFFQSQVYRSDGEYVLLPPGDYEVKVTRGPEYLTQTSKLHVPGNKDSMVAAFTLKRWVNMASKGWYSADHHVHAAGCSHYASPQEGVDANAMIRQVKGEDLNVAAVLTWGPGWYHQKNNFTGITNPKSDALNLMRYDVEVSGFPSSPSGHIVLLDLKEDDYPGTKQIEDWPSWTGPVLQWAKDQQAITGYAHSGWGLNPVEPTDLLPNYIMPAMDGIGANEYIVTATQGLVDFYSAGDTPAPWELNMWYHTLNCGMRTRISGETDFPCIFDERVGMARSYFPANGPVNYEEYISSIKNGRSYVSDGRSHIIDFSANEVKMGEKESELKLTAPSEIKVRTKVVAWLDPQQSEEDSLIKNRPLSEPPYWNIERARVGESRKVPVELIWNGVPVDTVMINADGNMKDVAFSQRVTGSGWLALRIYPSSHTNPIFVVMNKEPLRIQESIAWCRKAVDQCWLNKEGKIRSSEKSAAEAMYNKARAFYDALK